MFVSLTNYKNVNKCNIVAHLKSFGSVFIFIFLIFAFFNFLPNLNKCYKHIAVAENSVSEEDLSDSVEEVLNNIDFSEIELMLNEVDIDFNLFNGYSFKDYVSLIIKGEETLNINSFFNVLFSGLKVGIKSILTPLLCILIIVLLCNIFNNVRANKISGVSEIIYFICFALIIIIISSLLAGVISKSKIGIQSVQKQMNAVFPILLTLISTMGGIVSVKAYTPMLAFLSSIISNVFVYVLLPLFSISLILSIIGNLSENTKLTKLNGFIHSLYKWIIGVVFAVFMGFLSLKGITAGSSDGISIKATKYAIKNYIPILGGYISEGFELIKAGSMLVKNALGFSSIILLFASILAPIVSVAILQLGLKLLSGIIEPIGDKRSSTLIYSIANSLKLLVALLVGVALMYFLTVFLIICSASNFV